MIGQNGTKLFTPITLDFLSDALSTGTNFLTEQKETCDDILNCFVCVVFVIRARFMRPITFSDDGGRISKIGAKTVENGAIME